MECSVLADRSYDATRGWDAEFIPLMMLTQRLPGIMAHWRDAMSEFANALVLSGFMVANFVRRTGYQGSSSIAHLHGTQGAGKGYFF